MTQEEFAMKFDRMVAIYKPGSVVDKVQFLEYFKHLSGYPPDVIDEAITNLTKIKQYFPTPSELIAMADSISFNRRRLEDSRIRKEKDRKAAKEMTDAEYSHEAFEAVKRLTSGLATRREYIISCEALGMNMRPLRGYYEQFGEDLDKKPQGMLIRAVSLEAGR